MPSAEIITIGTEILLGEIVDTNTRYIARTLRGLGVDLYRTSTIGDNVERIAEAIKNAMSRADIIITTGGLGPTVDDPTREAVARACHTEVEFREELWEQILDIVTRYGRKPSENQKRQAYVPIGAKALKNEVGTAPAFIMEYSPRSGGQGAVISLPGVPKEMEWLLHEAVIPYLQTRFDLDEVIKVRLIHTAGAPEADIDEKIGDLETLTNPTVGLAAHTGIVDVRIAAKAKTEAEAEQMIQEVEAQVRARLGDLVYGVDADTLQEAALRAASERGWKLVAVEAGLGGALKRRLSNVQVGNLLGTEVVKLQPGELPASLEAAMQATGANAALGIAIFPESNSAELGLITPDRRKFRELSFGGHPGLLSRWALNLSLNWLRRNAKRND
ncbi:MAG: CinA family nicotinamide mononucleotide deamidase-related protein [Anaerolineales bacterium]